MAEKSMSTDINVRIAVSKYIQAAMGVFIAISDLESTFKRSIASIGTVCSVYITEQAKS